MEEKKSLGRPKGSKNKTTIMIEDLQRKVRELEEVKNSYDEVLDAFTEHFVMYLYESDIVKTVDNATLQTWFSNPDEYMSNIINLMTYYYIVDGNIFQLFDLIYSLPPLNYKITVLEKDEKTKDDLKTIKLYLEKKIRHKELTRDLMVQLASRGTLIGVWLGSKKDPYFYTFDNLDYVYPYGRYLGKMTAVVDLEWLVEKDEEERMHILENLNPIITQKTYDKYVNETNPDKKKELQYITLPVDTTLVERMHTLSRNQRLGIPFGTQSMFDIQHKQKLKDLEVAVANKIIKALAVLKFQGKDENGIKVSLADKRKVFAGVRNALEKNNKDNGITVVAIPDFSSIDFPTPIENGDEILKPEKYESINHDITMSTGVSPVLSNGTGGNYSSAYLNLEILYKKIDIILEKISLIYNQLINIVLGKRGNNYIFEYVPSDPLKKEKRIESLFKLHSEGYAVKPLVEELGLDFEEYIEQSLYEIETLGLRELIIPPKTSHTLSNDAGRPAGDNKEDNDDGNQKQSPSD